MYQASVKKSSQCQSYLRHDAALSGKLDVTQDMMKAVALGCRVKRGAEDTA